MRGEEREGREGRGERGEGRGEMGDGSREIGREGRVDTLVIVLIFLFIFNTSILLGYKQVHGRGGLVFYMWYCSTCVSYTFHISLILRTPYCKKTKNIKIQKNI